MKTKLKTQKAFIRVVSKDKLDAFLQKAYGYVYDAWHMERIHKMEQLHHVDGDLDFMEAMWQRFKKDGSREGLRSDIILNGLASEGRIPKGIYFIT